MLPRTLTLPRRLCAKHHLIWHQSSTMTTASAKVLPVSRKIARKVLTALTVAGVGSLVVYLTLPDASRASPTLHNAPLSPQYFTRALLASTVAHSGNSKLLTLAIPPHLIPQLPAHSVFSIYIKDADLQIERPYTPLDGIDELGRMNFWIKRYEDGEVSRWLCSRKPGETLEIRGPVPTFSLRGDLDEVFLISGGTGLTPFYQLLHHVFNHSIPTRTHFTLLHSSPSTSSLPPTPLTTQLLEWAASNPHRLAVSFFVDENDTLVPSQTLVPLREKRIGRQDIERALRGRRVVSPNESPKWWSWRRRSSEPKKILFIVCGPDGMMRALAGQKPLAQGAGIVGGVLAELGFTNDQVCKL